MEDLHIRGEWKQKKDTLLRNFSNLNDQNLVLNEGNEDELIERVGERLRISYIQARKIIRLA